MAAVRRVDGEVAAGKEEVKKRWHKYFEGLLNVLDNKKVVAVCLG